MWSQNRGTKLDTLDRNDLSLSLSLIDDKKWQSDRDTLWSALFPRLLCVLMLIAVEQHRKKKKKKKSSEGWTSSGYFTWVKVLRQQHTLFASCWKEKKEDSSFISPNENIIQ